MNNAVFPPERRTTGTSTKTGLSYFWSLKALDLHPKLLCVLGNCDSVYFLLCPFWLVFWSNNLNQIVRLIQLPFSHPASSQLLITLPLHPVIHCTTPHSPFCPILLSIWHCSCCFSSSRGKLTWDLFLTLNWFTLVESSWTSSTTICSTHKMLTECLHTD